MDIFGRSPISLPVLILGKTAMFLCCLFPFAGFVRIGEALYDSRVLRGAGAVLYGVGLVLVCAALLGLGRSAAVGLPDRPTELRTTGLYRFSRNPVYLGAYVACAGSCLMVLHPLNLLFLFIAVAVHHVIIRREERFLEDRFGNAWIAYRSTVRRYI